MGILSTIFKEVFCTPVFGKKEEPPFIFDDSKDQDSSLDFEGFDEFAPEPKISMRELRKQEVDFAIECRYEDMKIRQGEPIDAEEDRLWRQIAFTQVVDEYWERSQERKRANLEEERHRELIETIERGNVAAKAVDFARDNPFLAGFLGADLVDRFKK